MTGSFSYLPHGEELRLLSNSVEWSKAELSVQIVVAKGILPEISPGKICSSVMVEYIGQAIAAHIFLCRTSGGDAVEKPRPGYIVRVRNLQIDVESLKISDTLTVTVTRMEDALDCLRYHGEARLSVSTMPEASDILASGDLLVHLPSDSNMEGNMSLT